MNFKLARHLLEIAEMGLPGTYYFDVPRQSGKTRAACFLASFGGIIVVPYERQKITINKEISKDVPVFLHIDEACRYPDPKVIIFDEGFHRKDLQGDIAQLRQRSNCPIIVIGTYYNE